MSSGPRRVDFHHHMIVPAYNKARGVPQSTGWTADKSLALMDKYGIEIALVSSVVPMRNDPLLWGNDRRGIARELNEFGAKMGSDHPGRFGLFAALPMTDVDGSLAEIAYAQDTLKCDGFGIFTSYGDKWPGDVAFDPIFKELNRRRAIVFIHTTSPWACLSMVPKVGPQVVEFDCDSSRTVLSFLLNGTLQRYTDIRFIMCHSGGTVPVMGDRIRDRIDQHFSYPGAKTTAFKPYSENISPTVLPHLRGLYYEVAHAAYPEPLNALMNFVPTSHILFGTDCPAELVESTVEPLEAAKLPAETAHAINRGNAERLLPRLKQQTS